MFLGADGNPLEGEEPVAKSRPRNDASGGWIDGDANPFVGGQAGEDPIKTAAKEMQATTAMFAMQKAQMMGAGMGAIIGGGVPSADQIRAWQNGDTPSIQTNPYDHLTREEKIALIGQLQKSKAANEAHERQSALEGASPTDMVDPSVYLAKGGSKGPVATQYAPPKTQKQAPPPPVAPTADRAAPMAKAGAHV